MMRRVESNVKVTTLASSAKQTELSSAVATAQKPN